MPLKPVLEQLGYRLEPIANDHYLLTGFPQEIVVKDHYWICTDEAACPELRRGGNAIDFFVRLNNTSFNDAIRLLLSDTARHVELLTSPKAS
jgi:hypothetical protein